MPMAGVTKNKIRHDNRQCGFKTTLIHLSRNAKSNTYETG